MALVWYNIVRNCRVWYGTRRNGRVQYQYGARRNGKVWLWGKEAWQSMGMGQGWLSAIIVRSLPWSGQVWGVCPAPRALLWLEYTPYNTITRHPTPDIPHNTFQCHITQDIIPCCSTSCLTVHRPTHAPWAQTPFLVKYHTILHNMMANVPIQRYIIVGFYKKVLL